MRGPAAVVLVTALALLPGCEEETASEQSTSRSSGKAEIELGFSDFSYARRDGRHTYGHSRIFTETGGVGVLIVRGKVCVQNGAECADSLVGYRVEPSETLRQDGHYVATPSEKDRITLHYWAEDDAGNAFEFQKVLLTDGDKVTVE